MKVLVITLKKWWLGVSRLPGALDEAGFKVAAWCPGESFIARSSSVTRHFPWEENVKWGKRLHEIFNEWQPEIIVPGDEVIAHFLRKLAASPFIHRCDKNLRQVIIRSLGNPKKTITLDGKIRFQRLADHLGIRTPGDRPVPNLNAAVSAADACGYPVVLKDDCAVGGRGVRICPDWKTLEHFK